MTEINYMVMGYGLLPETYISICVVLYSFITVNNFIIDKVYSIMNHLLSDNFSYEYAMQTLIPVSTPSLTPTTKAIPTLNSTPTYTLCSTLVSTITPTPYPTSFCSLICTPYTCSNNVNYSISYFSTVTDIYDSYTRGQPPLVSSTYSRNVNIVGFSSCGSMVVVVICDFQHVDCYNYISYNHSSAVIL
jgi:hypothetical protein